MSLRRWVLLGLLPLVGVAGVAAWRFSPTRRPLISRIVADANAQNRGDPSYQVVGNRPVPLSRSAALKAVIADCNEGSGTRLVVAGMVKGPENSGSPLYWAVFVDPPGKHLAPSAETPALATRLNWIGAFVPIRAPEQLFCDFGHASNLPPLPVFEHSPDF